MFVTRLISGIVLLTIAVITVISGGSILFGTVIVISMIGLFELYRVLNIQKSGLALVGYLTALSSDLLIYFEKTDIIIFVLIMGFILLMILYVLYYPKFNSEQVTMVFFGIFYVAILLSYIYRIRVLDGGIYMVWLIFIGAWGSDTCAYAVGILLGKHKLPSELSPKKTMEGSIGGIIGAALISFIYASICKDNLTMFTEPQMTFTIIGATSAVISQLGDLAASAIKRNHNIKDYGKLIPGHGGILDRFDSIIFIAPIVYYLVEVLR